MTLTLLLYGIATSGVVLSTLLEAADADFHPAAIKDCCADLDSSLHDCLINKFFPSYIGALGSGIRRSPVIHREFSSVHWDLGAALRWDRQ
jgi:nicotinamidase-related amidase